MIASSKSKERYRNALRHVALVRLVHFGHSREAVQLSVAIFILKKWTTHTSFKHTYKEIRDVKEHEALGSTLWYRSRWSTTNTCVHFLKNQGGSRFFRSEETAEYVSSFEQT